MNLFEYTLANEQLSTLKTKKVKEEFIRDIYARITVGNRLNGATHCRITDFEALSFLLCIYTLAINSLDKELPAYIHQTKDALTSRVYKQAIAHNIPTEAVEEAVMYQTTSGDELTYGALSHFLAGAIVSHSPLSAKAKLKLLDIVRDSCAA